ncbi:hypothetical protein Nepgr_008061 [Nepenthes gracilis]|uniref:Secreted protein n=1 Tax=Nepenthes gracilis TaxID=150966 RepID=A0AAD3S8D6_NEPGR|nr:hypothetical protein Nepgr_008061 [Nepenthes gracilis]
MICVVVPLAVMLIRGGWRYPSYFMDFGCWRFAASMPGARNVAMTLGCEAGRNYPGCSGCVSLVQGQAEESEIPPHLAMLLFLPEMLWLHSVCKLSPRSCADGPSSVGTISSPSRYVLKCLIPLSLGRAADSDHDDLDLAVSMRLILLEAILREVASGGSGMLQLLSLQCAADARHQRSAMLQGARFYWS